MGLSEFLARRAARSRRKAESAAELRAHAAQMSVPGVKKQLRVDDIPGAKHEAVKTAQHADSAQPPIAPVAAAPGSVPAITAANTAANPAAAAKKTSTAPRVFSVDRSKMFDLHLTSTLYELAQVPADQRDAQWQAEFIKAAWNASTEIPAEPFFHGPDGFVYLRLQVPAAGAFESNCMANKAGEALEQMYGIAIFASPVDQHAQYVFSMGVIDSLLRYDTWLGDPQDLLPAAPRTERAGERRQVLLGSPSQDYLPPALAKALYTHMTQGWHMPVPRVQVRIDAASTPSRSLMLNRRMSEFASPEEGAAQCQRLLWYLPPNRAVSLLPEDWDDSGMTPLAELAGAAR